MIGKQIKKIIIERGYRLDKVAEALGITRGSLSRKINHRQGLRLSAQQIKQIGQYIDQDLTEYVLQTQHENENENQL